MNYLLDTNIVLTCLRTNELSRKLAKSLNLFSPNVSLLISVVSIGELKSIAKQNNWGEKKVNALLEWLDSFVVLDINIEGVQSSIVPSIM
jgi:tRNA(fMet)-specific endonuclease VapC